MYPIYPLLCFMGAHALDTILMCLGNIGSFFGLSSWSHKKFAGMFICILIALPPGLSRISASHRNFGGNDTHFFHLSFLSLLFQVTCSCGLKLI